MYVFIHSVYLPFECCVFGIYSSPSLRESGRNDREVNRTTSFTTISGYSFAYKQIQKNMKMTNIHM